LQQYQTREAIDLGDFDCLLIGKELINKIRASTIDWGYINGFTHDDVFCAFSADIGEKNSAVCQASLLISQHRFFDNNYKKGILLWVKISNDLLKQIKNIYISVEELKEKMPCGLFEKLDKKGLNYMLLLGETDKDYRFCLVFKRKDEEKFAFVPGDIELLDEEPNPFKRIDGLVPIEELKEKKVAIIGVGSGGSFIALELASAGVGTLNIFDNDRLSVVNLFRHACDKRDLGRKKVDAIHDTIKEHLLPTEIIKNPYNIMNHPEKLRDVVNGVDLVICATDNVKSRELVNYICVNAQKPLVLVCTFDNARIGEIIRVIPKETACYECVRTHQREQGSLINANYTDDEPIPYSSQIREKENENIGTRTDVFMVAALASKVALMTLTEGKKIFGELPFNYITWGSVRNMDFNPPFSFNLPFTTNYCNYLVNPHCPICGDLPSEIADINIEERYNEIMAELLSKQV
jgi:molybdopterin/thiamine biosynthesis adenylyltransferase